MDRHRAAKHFESLSGHSAELGEDDALSHFNSHLQPTDCHVVHIWGLFRDDFAA